MNYFSKAILMAASAAVVALMLVLGVSMGTAAAPDPLLSDDLVFVGNGKGAAATGNDIKVVDIDAMAVVNTIGSSGLLANNHGVLVDGNNLWSANAALSGYNSRIVKLDLGTMTQTSFDAVSPDGAFSLGFCGIEEAPNGNIWATSMSASTTNGGVYEFDKTTGTTGSFIDTSSGTDNGATCGIGWNTGGTVAYSSLMSAKKLTTHAWPGGSITGSTAITDTGSLHILDVAKSSNYAYVAAGNVSGVGKLAIIDLDSMTQVGIISGAADSGDWHGPTVAHDEGFLYVHSRGGSSGINADYPGSLFIYDIGGGTAGGTKTVPVLIGTIADGGTPAVSCGTDVATKSDYCGEPTLSATREASYYASAEDEAAGILSVDYSINNDSAGSLNVNSVEVTGASNSDGVTLNTAMPAAVANIPAGGSSAVTLKYNVPGGVTTFTSELALSADNLCADTVTPVTGQITLFTDGAAPIISDNAPTGWSADTNHTISALYSDADSGIDSASVSVYLDGSALEGCVVTGAGVDCAVTDLADGPYDVNLSVADNAGNTAQLGWEFSVDTTAPMTSASPTGWQTSPFTVDLNCDDWDGVGCDAASIQYRVNFADCPEWQCELEVPANPEDTGSWKDGASVAVDTEGVHIIDFFAADLLGNTEDPFNTETVGLDMTDPELSNNLPTGFITDSTPVISADYSDAVSGLVVSSSNVTIDGNIVDDCDRSSGTGVTCNPAGALDDGLHTAVVDVLDLAGNTGELEWTFNVDTTAPVVTGVAPSGNVNNTLPDVIVDFSDGEGSGVDPDSVAVSLQYGGDPQSAYELVCDTPVGDTVTCFGIDNPELAVDSTYDVILSIADEAGNSDETTAGSFTVVSERTYYFTWYDNNKAWGMNGDWILITNEGVEAATAEIYVGDTKVATYVDIPVGDQVVWSAPGTVTGGTVKVVSTTGEELLVSQRVLYQDSFNEIMAVEDVDLHDDNHFTWYDNNAAWGMNGNWILVANTGNTEAEVEIYIGDPDTPKDTVTIPAGEQIQWQSPSTITAGPVRVLDLNGNKLLVSQRVIYKDAFNELMSVPANQLDTQAYFTWYDNNGSWGMNANWIVATNLGDTPTDVEIYVGDTTGTPVEVIEGVPGHTAVTWQAPENLTDGPVRVVSTQGNLLLVSQRVLYMDSFEEVQGVIPGAMSDSAGFSWYDSQPANGMNGAWILIGNWEDGAVSQDIEIRIGGVLQTNPADGTSTFPVAAGQSITPSFTNLMAGPVEVTCTTCAPEDKLIISQRVIFKNSFNELIAQSYSY